MVTLTVGAAALLFSGRVTLTILYTSSSLPDGLSAFLLFFRSSTVTLPNPSVAFEKGNKNVTAPRALLHYRYNTEENARCDGRRRPTSVLNLTDGHFAAQA
ncbi:hypothetical protein B0H11DRAFT_1908547 [Mycena galericulata]|nr:hypothetical protein B0H11DRAFT_1908547 [Mycena galericulata]